MSLIQTLKHKRERFLDRHAEAGDWSARLFSATTYSLWRACRAPMAQRCVGLVLDAGSGRGSWRKFIQETASGYESIDLSPRGGNHPTWIGDVSNMPQVPDLRYDTIVCHQVLEHVRQPWRALTEFHRVLRPGGTLVVSVPHLSRRHELPHDYFRLTPEGLSALLGDAGYEAVALHPYGGILSFIHHQTSFFFPGLLLGIPLLGIAATVLNALASWLLANIDSALDRRSLMPVGVLAVATKPAQAAQSARLANEAQ